MTQSINARLNALERTAGGLRGPTHVFDERGGELFSAKTGQPVTVGHVNRLDAAGAQTLVIRSFDGPHVEGLNVDQVINLGWGSDELAA